MIKKYCIVFILFILIISGCKENNFNNHINFKEAISSYSWYQVDDTRDRYVVHRFVGDKYIKKIYASRNFDNLIDTYSGSIEEIDENASSMLIKLDNHNLLFTFCGDVKKGYQIYCEKSLEDKKEICDSLWKSKSLAIRNTHLSR